MIWPSGTIDVLYTKQFGIIIQWREKVEELLSEVTDQYENSNYQFLYKTNAPIMIKIIKIIFLKTD